MKVVAFNNIGKLVRDARGRTRWSQADLGVLVGMLKGQGQHISNIERGLCNVPPKRGPTFCKILNIEPDVMIEAMVQDFRESLVSEFNQQRLPEEVSQ